MAMSNAQRQAAYRARHLAHEEGRGERLNTVIDLHARRALERLAACYGFTQRAILERLLIEAERDALDRAAGTPNGPEDYYAGRLRLEADTLQRNDDEFSGNGEEAGRQGAPTPRRP